MTEYADQPDEITKSAAIRAIKLVGSVVLLLLAAWPALLLSLFGFAREQVAFLIEYEQSGSAFLEIVTTPYFSALIIVAFVALVVKEFKVKNLNKRLFVNAGALIAFFGIWAGILFAAYAPIMNAPAATESSAEQPPRTDGEISQQE